MNKIADIWQNINGSGILLIVAIYLWSYVKPLIDDKAKHASTVQSKEMWQLLENVADTAVNSLISKPVAGSIKFDTATQYVQSEMTKQGFDVDDKTAGMAVQSAYEKSDLTGNSNAIDPVKVAIKTAPNRSDQLLMQGKEEQAKG